MLMRVEIDQSGKLEQLNTDTVVAYSDGSYGTIVLKTIVKQKIIRELRKSLIPRRDIVAIWFAVVVYLLIKDLAKNTVILLDEEYTGKNTIIEEALSKLLQQRFHYKWIGSIRFQQIGKDSPAHKLAWSTHRTKRRVGVRKLTVEDIISFM